MKHRDVSLQAGIALRGAPGLLRVLRLLPSVFEAPEQFQMVHELGGLRIVGNPLLSKLPWLN